MYFQAQKLLKDLVLYNQSLPAECENLVISFQSAGKLLGSFNFGVFDALFGVLIELGMLEEASECFYRMREFRIFPS